VQVKGNTVTIVDVSRDSGQTVVVVVAMSVAGNSPDVCPAIILLEKDQDLNSCK
jgi:hypothetical protein